MMRTAVPERLERGRVRVGGMGSDASYGMCGAFAMVGPCGADMVIIVADPYDPAGQGWEHVSVSLKSRNPNWQEMCFVKDLCWDESEMVLQFHPPKDKYINMHPYCLHMWRPTDNHVRMPPLILV